MPAALHAGSPQATANNRAASHSGFGSQLSQRTPPASLISRGIDMLSSRIAMSSCPDRVFPVISLQEPSISRLSGYSPFRAALPNSVLDGVREPRSAEVGPSLGAEEGILADILLIS